MNKTATDLWQTALAELELQMTHATFDAWLRGTHADPASNGTLIVRTKNKYAVEWLDNRLRPAIERTLRSIAGENVPVTFVVDNNVDPEPSAIAPVAPVQDSRTTQQAQIDALLVVLERIEDPPARAVIVGQIRALGGVPPQEEVETPTQTIWTPPDVDTSNRWFPVPEYANKFWAPLLGRIAFRVWMIVRQKDTRPAKVKRQDEWTPPKRFTAPELAREVPCGRQSITGAWRSCDPDHPDAVLRTPKRIIPGDEPASEQPYRRQVGALETLEAEHLALVTSQGQRRHKTYTIQVQLVPPVLSPAQVARLDEELQVQHDRWLLDAGVDLDDWRQDFY
jgi:chromosomal replication initiator protein